MFCVRDSLRDQAEFTSKLIADRKSVADVEIEAHGIFLSLFECLQIRQQIVDLVRIELELRHGRMSGLDAFGERLRQVCYRIALVQGPERRRNLERALADAVDGVTPCAIVECERLAALLFR